MKSLKIVLLLLVCVSCSERYKSVETVWYKGDSEPPLQIAKRSDLEKLNKSVTNKFETVTHYVQKIGPAEVENSYLQTVVDKSGRAVFMGANISRHPKDYLKSEIKQLEEQKEKFKAQLKEKFTEIQEAKFLSEPQVVYSNKRAYSSLFYRIFLINKEGTSAERWYVTSEMRILEKSPVGSDLSGRGYVYPEGPLWSQLQSVMFNKIKDSGEIGSDNVVMTTQADKQAQANDGVFQYDLKDPRFDQIQVFHYLNAALKAFKDKLGVSLSRKLEVQTHLGYPDKKNAAFYFDYKINFGEGDGKKYKSMMRDPTVVYHEISHAFIDEIGGLPRGSVNEAFADFFTCSFLDHPMVGEASYLDGPYTRSMENQLTYEDKNDKLYHDSQIVSGTLWDIREKLGAAKAEELSLKIVSRLGPRDKLEDFLEVLTKVVESDFSKTEQEKVLEVLKARKWKD